MTLGLIAIGIVLGLCAAAAGVNAETRRANHLRDRLRAFESKR